MPFSLLNELKQSWLWLALGIALILLLSLLGPVLTPFVAAAIIAYALNPGVDGIAARRLGRFRVPRALAVVIMMLILFTVLLALVFIVVPVLQKEIPLMQSKVPILLSKLNAVLAPELERMGVQVTLDVDGIGKILSRHLSSNADGLWGTVFASAKVGGVALLGWIVNICLIPIVLFYLLLDWHPMLAWLKGAIPRRWVDKTVALAEEVDALMAQYFRGQLLVMVVLASYYSIALTIAGFDVAMPVGILTGLLVFIPYIGFGLGLILALIAAVLQFDSMHGLIAIALIYGTGQVVEGFFLTPRLVGERIGLHPLVVIFALLAFGQLFGFVGVLLALPASAVISVGFKHVRAHYLRSSFYVQP